jgi:hypothetical protein
VNVKLAEDALDVAADGLGRQAELDRDALGRVARAQQVEDLPFTSGQRAANWAHADAAGWRRLKIADQLAGQGPLDRRLAAAHAAQDTRQHGDVDVLGEEADRTDVHRQHAEIVVVGNGEDDHGRPRRVFDQSLRRGDPIGSGHHHVHQHEIRAQLHSELVGLVAVARLTHDVDPRALELVADHPPRHRVVVGDEHAQRRRLLVELRIECARAALAGRVAALVRRRGAAKARLAVLGCGLAGALDDLLVGGIDHRHVN